MKAARKSELSPAERAIARRVSAPPTIDAFPIPDPDLAALSELLHRMTVCQEDTPATRMAGEAIKKLQAYVIKQRKAIQEQG